MEGWAAGLLVGEMCQGQLTAKTWENSNMQLTRKPHLALSLKPDTVCCMYCMYICMGWAYRDADGAREEWQPNPPAPHHWCSLSCILQMVGWVCHGTVGEGSRAKFYLTYSATPRSLMGLPRPAQALYLFSWFKSKEQRGYAGWYWRRQHLVQATCTEGHPSPPLSITPFPSLFWRPPLQFTSLLDLCELVGLPQTHRHAGGHSALSPGILTAHSFTRWQSAFLTSMRQDLLPEH